ncbi:hypothetical protein [Propionibacterium sp. oral taxon 192]|uniref:hypothetical protein n=1 Tax=Propionibacterium sp. oral taxon 192 TaxID=671222 RepID=UPI0012EB8630|nr:hypothetical protein [Propionibacterium sp. oral taxon 192]
MDKKVHAINPPKRRKPGLLDFSYSRYPGNSGAALKANNASKYLSGNFGSFLVPGGGFMVSVIFYVIGGGGFLGCR